MATLSDPTLGLLVRIAPQLFSLSKLRTLLMEADLRRYAPDPDEENSAELVRGALLGARDHADQREDQQARRGLLAFVRLLVEGSNPNVDPNRELSILDYIEELHEALLADGYELTWETEEHPWGYEFIRCQLRPTDPAPVPLAPETSALEAELADRGYTDALNHYRQAVDSLLHHNYEAANGQLRTALEDLTTRLARQHAGYVEQGKAGKGGNAIQHMINHGALPDQEGGKLLQGLWHMTHTRGGRIPDSRMPMRRDSAWRSSPRPRGSSSITFRSSPEPGTDRHDTSQSQATPSVIAAGRGRTSQAMSISQRPRGGRATCQGCSRRLGQLPPARSWRSPTAGWPRPRRPRSR
jgi:hypothetical protein